MTATAIKPKRVLPGFSLSLGTTLLYVALIILIPVLALVLKGAEIGPAQFWSIVTAPRTLAALRVTVTAAFVATVFNALYGPLLAWVLTRHDFPGKRILDDQSPDLAATNMRLTKKDDRPTAGKTIKNPFRTYPLIVQGGGGGRPK